MTFTAGDIRKGIDIGFKTKAYMKYVACPTCGNLRWVQIREGRPTTNKCLKCALKDNKRKLNIYNPLERNKYETHPAP